MMRFSNPVRGARCAHRATTRVAPTSSLGGSPGRRPACLGCRDVRELESIGRSACHRQRHGLATTRRLAACHGGGCGAEKNSEASARGGPNPSTVTPLTTGYAVRTLCPEPFRLAWEVREVQASVSPTPLVIDPASPPAAALQSCAWQTCI